jgi:hypothetical protein
MPAKASELQTARACSAERPDSRRGRRREDLIGAQRVRKRILTAMARASRGPRDRLRPPSHLGTSTGHAPMRADPVLRPAPGTRDAKSLVSSGHDRAPTSPAPSRARSPSWSPTCLCTSPLVSHVGQTPQQNYGAGPAVQTSSPSRSPRGAQYAVGGMRAWGENPGRGADWLATLRP